VVAVAAMPALTWLYVHKVVPVPAWAMFKDILLIVLVPVAAGVALNSRFHTRLQRARPYFPLVSALAIIIIIAIIVALNRGNLANIGPILVLGVAAHNLLGLSIGFLVPKLLGYPRDICRTLAIEVGMQNSGLSASLASKYFSALTALPAAIFSIWHNLSGALFAAYWARQAENTKGAGNDRPA
jgi:BASS family bile acid:Na+ symporter